MSPLQQLTDQRGMILFSSLLILSFLMALGIGSVVSVQSEYRITGNLKSGTSALYIAEAGVEWGKQQIGLSNENPPVLADARRNFSTGEFSIGSVSSKRTSPLVGEVVYRSDGKLGAATQIVQVQVRKSYDLADAPLVLRGNSRSVQFPATSFTISGLDYDPVDGTPIAGARQRRAVSVDRPLLLTQTRDALTGAQNSLLTGTDNRGASISISDRISADAILRVTSAACAASQAQTSAVPADGRLSVVDRAWGSRANPEIHCVQGSAQPGDQVIAGNVTGAGILVIRDAALVLSGTFRWEGLVIVAGSDVGLRVSGEENKDVYGALMITETGQALGVGDPMVNVEGALRIRFSRSALASAARLIPAETLDNLYSALPFYIAQDYWRILTP